MPAFNEVNILSLNMANKVHNFNTDTFRWILSNTLPAVANEIRTDITQIATGGGYTQMTDGAGGLTVTVSAARVGATTTVSCGSAGFTATGPVAQFKYCVLVDDTPASPLNPLIGWVELTTAITMALNDTFTIPVTANVFTIN